MVESRWGVRWAAMTGLRMLVVGAVLVVASNGCGLLAESGGRPVTIVGDSLVVLGDRKIRDVLKPAGWRVTVDAYPGVTVTTQMPALTKAAGDRQRAIVIELGTNDTHAFAQGETDARAEGEEIHRALELFAPSQCLVWVNADAEPSRPGGRGGKVVNDALAAAATSRPDLHVADLNAMLRAHPEYLLGDGVHLTDAGSTALGQLMANALNACQ